MYKELMNIRSYKQVAKEDDCEKIIPFEDYINILDKLSKETHKWSFPRIIEICKSFSQKRRIVYSYPKEEMFVLRAVNSYLCRKYRSALAVSYFPSRQRTPSQCLAYIMCKMNKYQSCYNQIYSLYGLNMDVSDYFNSMDTGILFERLPEELKKDKDFLRLYKDTIQNPWCLKEDKLVYVEKKGAMAGLPFTAFFAAIYLSGMDRRFEKEGVPYVRYSDDILFFVENEAKLKYWSFYASSHIIDSGLNINLDKTVKIKPYEPWTFIGFEINQGRIVISEHQYQKIKRRIGKWAKKYRKRVDLGAGKNNYRISPEKAVTLFIKNINRAFFKPIKDKYCWAQWAFPTINDSSCLRKIDKFIQEKLRFVFTGRYSKKNYRLLPYERLKGMGYHSLEKLYNLYRFRPEDYNEFILLTQSTSPSS